MPVAEGSTLAHFKITAKLGEGGMGVVWQAEDTKLDRLVALKVLPEALAADPDRLQRFEREAKTVASLNHQNIVTLYSVEADKGLSFLTMELVEGETLDRHIPATGLPLSKLFDLAIPLADALAEAHDKGITHRDLKPANVMVNTKGQVKVLDFGLAKLSDAEIGPEIDDSEETAALTQEGLVVGTARYMSPEQARGAPADHRSDVFSLGILLYEMATGQRPFEGKSSVELFSSLLRDEPQPIHEVRHELPRHLGRIVRRCLEKEPEKRYQTALEVRNELQDLKREIGSDLSRTTAVPSALPRPSGPGQRTGWQRSLIALVVAIAIPLGWWALRPDENEREAAGSGTAEPAGLIEISQASIAVLPFANSAEQDTQYFVDGMHDDLLTQLASIPDLRVISRTSVLEYRDTTMNVRQIGQELGVDNLLEGTVRRAGDRVRINVQLIDAATDDQRWGTTFDRDLSPENLFEIQMEIASAIAEALATKLSSGDRALSRAPTRNQQAYDLYQQARGLASDSGQEELTRAIDLAERAVELDPEFALAMGEVSRAYLAMYWFQSRLPEHREAAKLWLDRALAIEPDDPRLQFALARYLYHGHLDYKAALVALDRAEVGLPGDSEIYHTRGAILRRLGDFDGSFAAQEKGLLLDPRDTFMLAHHMWTYAAIGEVEGARRIAQRVRGFPGVSDLYIIFGLELELRMLGETAPLAEFIRENPDAEFGNQEYLRPLIPLLERRYEDVWEVLAKMPDPVVWQHYLWPHRHFRARILHAQGRVGAAREQAELAVEELIAIAATMPDDPRPIAARAFMQAILGNEAAARRDANHAMELYPVARDALTGPEFVASRLKTLAVFVDTEELARELESYLTLPSKLAYVDFLLLDPVFDRHRSHPAIESVREKYTLRKRGE